MNLKEAIEKYLLERAKSLRPNTLRNYTQILRDLEDRLGPDRPLASISDSDVTRYQLYLKEAGKSVNTQLNYANSIRPFFRYWNEEGFCLKVRPDRIRGPRREEACPRFVTPKQFARIDACFGEEEYADLQKKVIFNMLWDTGVRIGELLALDIADIDRNKPYTTLRTEKSRRFRIVVWSERTHRLLVRYLGVRICLNQRPELFQTPFGTTHYKHRRGRLTARSVQRWCQLLQKELGFRVHPHAFRHGKMHQIINRGGNRHHVQTVAGHSSIESSEVYVRLNEQEQLRVQQRFLDRPKTTENKKSPYYRLA